MHRVLLVPILVALSAGTWGSAEHQFGLDERMLHDGASDVAEIRSAVSEAAIVAHQRVIVRLANDQVWEETEARRTGLEPGTEVTITRGSLGSFRMIRDDNSRSTTVRRVPCGVHTGLSRADRRKCEAMGF